MTDQDNKQPTLLELCRTSLYIGAIGYGGPAVLALMKKTYVNKKKWITDNDFMDALSLAQVLPSSTGIAITSYIGYKLHKLWGAVLAPIFTMLPAAVAITVLAWAYFRFGNLSFVKVLFAGLGALVVALLLNATYFLGKSVFKNIPKDIKKDARSIIIGLATFIGIYSLKFNVTWLILFAALAGFFLYYFTKDEDNNNAPKSKTLDITTSRVKGKTLKFWDYTPVLLVLAIFVFGLLTPSLRKIVTTFLGIGALAFGGGFGSVPLIQHQVVQANGWLNTKQFIDGIALGQITPGPIFITATFIGYHVAAIFGAVLATLAIFAPSTTAMILLSSVHDKVRDLKAVRAVIKGLQAGFIGLLVSVTIQFALKSLISWQAWLIFSLAIIWLMILKKNVVWAILATIPLSLLLFA